MEGTTMTSDIDFRVDEVEDRLRRLENLVQELQADVRALKNPPRNIGERTPPKSSSTIGDKKGPLY